MEEFNYYPVTLPEINGQTTTARGSDLSILTNGPKSDASLLHYHAGGMSQGQTSQAINVTTTITIPHGLKVIPSLVSIVCYTNIGDDGGGFPCVGQSFGTFDGTTQSCTSMSWELNASSRFKQEQTSGKIIRIKSNDGASLFQCTAAIDKTNITLTINDNTNTGSARLLQWIAYK